MARRGVAAGLPAAPACPAGEVSRCWKLSMCRRTGLGVVEHRADRAAVQGAEEGSHVLRA